MQRPPITPTLQIPVHIPVPTFTATLPLLPQHPVTPATATPPMTFAPTQVDIVADQDRSKLSPTSMLPSLKYIDDPSLFDLDALTCHACNKSFKNTRAFKLHRDRHQVHNLFLLLNAHLKFCLYFQLNKCSFCGDYNRTSLVCLIISIE